jgi:uncharacterized MAPEG superfamily protein
MTLELWILLLSGFLGIVHLSAASISFKALVGNQYTMGSRDEDLKRTGVAGRLDRAQRNFLETFSIFSVCVLLVHLTGVYGSLSQWGSILYLVGRVLYLPLYAFGIPWLRSFSWSLATFGLVLVGAQVVVGNV